MLRRLLYVLCGISLALTSCKHDAPTPPAGDGNYPADVANIIMNKCVSCHNQANYKAPKKEKEEKKIEKGQLNVETDLENRFMNARLTNPKIVQNLNGKFKTDVFVFINQLDIKASGSKSPLDLGDGNPNRKIIVHYTILTKEGREINSGTIEEEFSPELNVPKKIIDKHFSKIALTLVQRVNRALLVPVK